MSGDTSQFAEQPDKLVAVYTSAVEVLAGLDELQLNQAGAYVAMALDVMRRDYPQLAAFD